MDLRLKHGRTHSVVGPSACGKTSHVARILRLRHELLVGGSEIQNVVYCFANWQPIYDTLKKDNIVTKWVPFKPTNEQFIELVHPFKHKGGSIVVVDDFMTEITKDDVKIVCVTSRHENTTTFLLLQSLFPPNPLARQISLNAAYHWIFKNPRENSQLQYLARQLRPNNYKWIVQAYHTITAEPFSYLFVDLTQETSENLRFRSNVLPYQFPMRVWMPKEEVHI